jgi:hypothetical protein
LEKSWAGGNLGAVGKYAADVLKEGL